MHSIPPSGLTLGVRLKLAIREMQPRDGLAFVEVHHAAVREIAADVYPPAIIEAWAPLPITSKVLARMLANRENEIRLVAEIGNTIVGVGAVAVEEAELRGCYVMPKATRMGIGSALVVELQKIASINGVTRLTLNAPSIAVPFFARLGYEELEASERVFRFGERMNCLRMGKNIVGPNDAVTAAGPERLLIPFG